MITTLIIANLLVNLYLVGTVKKLHKENIMYQQNTRELLM